jgi:cytoskeletal protein CcmA (bactofilin family)
VVVAILAINVGVVMFLLRGNSTSGGQTNKDEVVISTENLDKLGVSKTAVGNLGTELIVGPNSTFNNKVTVAGDVSIAGQLRLNSKFSANDASLTNLQAGNTALQQLNVNGESSLSTLNLRNDLNVTGATKLQGAVTVSQLMTINNSLNVTGNLAVGGTLSARSFQASSLVSDSTLTIGGHIITRGLPPSVSPGSGIGSNGTVSISGSDAAGTVAVNAGVGASGGIVAYVTFRNPYGGTPRVLVTAIGSGATDVYVNRTSTGFSIGVGSLSIGGHAFDYIVMQ